MWSSRGLPASKATGSKARAQSVATSERFTGSMAAGRTPLSARARVSICSTRELICLASERMLPLHRAGLSVSPAPSSSSALERITVKGVFSSWEASDKNCRCCFHAFSTGRVTHRDAATAIASSTSMAARAMTR